MNAPSNTCLMYLLRHGATENNLADPPRLQGRRVDGPLSAEGRRQAEFTGAFLSQHRVHAVYSSPLRRARETAEIIAASHGLTVQNVDAISEVDVGNWEGRSWVEIAQTDREYYRRFLDDPGQYGYLGGENLVQVRDRVVPAMRQLMHGNLGHLIVVVAHNIVNRVLLSELMGLSLREGRGLSQHNCGLSVIRFQGDEMTLLTMNSFFHLR